MLQGKVRIFLVDLHGVIEVTSRRDLILQILLLLPIYGALSLFIWKLSGHPFGLISNSLALVLILGMVLLFFLNGLRCWKVNIPRLQTPHTWRRKIFVQPDRYIEHGLFSYIRFRVGGRFDVPAVYGNDFFHFLWD